MDLIDFVKYIENDTSLMEEVKDCKNGDDFLLFLKKYDCDNLFVEIKSRSRDLAAEYWPWAKLDRKARKKFFNTKK